MASRTDGMDQRITTIRSLYNTKELKDEQDLYFAAMSGNVEEMTKVLQSGVCVEVKHIKFQSCSSWTPLQIATMEGHHQCVKLLIDYGANFNVIDEVGCTPVHVAAKNNRYLCLKVLLEAGADYSAFVQRPFLLRARPGTGTTALHLAATYHNAKCIDELMQYGADCETVDENGRTSLYIAAETGCKQCVLALLRNIRGLKCVSLPSFHTSDSPLHHAVKHRMEECVKELVRLGADVNHTNNKGLSPLHVLLMTWTARKHKSDMEILKCLVLDSDNIDINKATKEGKTALHFAVNAAHFNPEIFVFLVTYGADVSKKIEYIPLSLLHLELMRPIVGFDTLKCLINCMPQLPRLASLKYVWSDSDIRLRGLLPEEKLQSILGNFSQGDIGQTSYTNIVYHFVHQWRMIQLPMENDQKVDSLQVKPECNVAYQPTPNPLEQPFLDKIYELVTQELDCIKDNQAYSPNACNLLLLRKKLWYERLASNPLTLKHFCRFSIRNCMGPSRLKHISKLPLPERCKAYLLFKWDEKVEP